jgi:hypothetical protein
VSSVLRFAALSVTCPVAGHSTRKLSVNNIHVCFMELTRMFIVCCNQCWTFHLKRNKDLSLQHRGSSMKLRREHAGTYWMWLLIRKHGTSLFVVCGDTCSLWHGVISHCCCAKGLVNWGVGTLSLTACWLMTCFQGVENTFGPTENFLYKSQCIFYMRL